MTRQELTEAVRKRPRTVWDARALSAPARDRLLPIEIDDGQSASSRLYGIFRDVVRGPDGCFLLVFQGLLPTRMPEVRLRRNERYEIVRLPTSIIRQLPPVLSFMLLPVEDWRMPELFVSCPSCQFGAAPGEVNPGRFCVECGVVIRQGRWRKYPGEGFLAAQALIHAADNGQSCDVCGGGVLPDHRFCMKCGTGGEGV